MRDLTPVFYTMGRATGLSPDFATTLEIYAPPSLIHELLKYYVLGLPCLWCHI